MRSLIKAIKKFFEMPKSNSSLSELYYNKKILNDLEQTSIKQFENNLKLLIDCLVDRVVTIDYLFDFNVYVYDFTVRISKQSDFVRIYLTFSEGDYINNINLVWSSQYSMVNLDSKYLKIMFDTYLNGQFRFNENTNEQIIAMFVNRISSEILEKINRLKSV